MARPTKQGIDYFPLDCQFDNEIEMYLIEKNATGLAVLITLWQLIYSNDGYYIKDDKDLKLLIKKRINVDINEVNDCINLCLSRNIFNKSLYKKYKILTSRGIQKRYFDASKKKKIVNVCENWVLVDINATNVNVKEEEEEKVNVKEKENIILIINYLNNKSGKSYKYNTKSTVRLINARFKEGFVLGDFYKVIDNKSVDEYFIDNNYVRPETLFGTKFESYLNEKQKSKKKSFNHKDLVEGVDYYFDEYNRPIRKSDGVLLD